jgi:CheY-like chemotaxis protein
MTTEKSIRIMMADDDVDDRMLALEAFKENKLKNELSFTENGEDLLNFLNHKGKYNKVNAPLPDLILLDLNMPKVSGLEALKLIKEDERLRTIPVIMLTTSSADEDIVNSYKCGVNSFITKPVTFDQLVDVIGKMCNYWFKIVKLPSA